MAMVIGNRVRNGDLEDLMVLSVMVAAVVSDRRGLDGIV